MDREFKHMLVPLDGSELAEVALVDAFALAKLIKAEVTVLQVIPPVKDIIEIDERHAIFLDEQSAALKAKARHYLNNICQRVGCEDLRVHTVVEMGSPAETIINYTYKHPIDLIVMATHGRSGFSRWAYGSVADKVLRGADRPVLLVRAYPQREMTRG